jgi:hypothetical protein
MIPLVWMVDLRVWQSVKESLCQTGKDLLAYILEVVGFAVIVVGSALTGAGSNLKRDKRFYKADG